MCFTKGRVTLENRLLHLNAQTCIKAGFHNCTHLDYRVHPSHFKICSLDQEYVQAICGRDWDD